MSLSRYFTSSQSFQPEDIVKKQTPVQPGWKAVKNHEQKIFQSQHPLDSTEQKQKCADKKDILFHDNESNKNVSEDTHDDDSLPTDDNYKKHIAKKNGAPTAHSDDYISLAEAKEKIETAYVAGQKEGKDKAEADFGGATRALLNACQQLETLRETLITNSSLELQEFSLTIAERIIRSSVRTQDTTIVATIEEALHRAVKSDEFYIYINPADYDIVLEKSEEFTAGISGLNNVVIKKDATIERGGAKIESENCTIDATIASQFEMIRDEIIKNG